MPEGMSMETIVPVTLEDLDGGRTKMTLNQTGFPSEDWAAGARGGWNQAFDKLVAVFVGGWRVPEPPVSPEAGSPGLLGNCEHHGLIRRQLTPLGPRGPEGSLIERLAQSEDLGVVLLAFERGHRGLGDLAEGLARPEQARRPNAVSPGHRQERERLELVGDRPAIPAALPAVDRVAILGRGLVDPAVTPQGMAELALGGELEAMVVHRVELGLGFAEQSLCIHQPSREAGHAVANLGER